MPSPDDLCAASGVGSPIETSARESAKRPDRHRKSLIAAHVDPETRRAFKTLVAHRNLTTDLALHEALCLLLSSHHVPIPAPLLDKMLRVLEVSKYNEPA
jgi:hypothetical protein